MVGILSSFWIGEATGIELLGAGSLYRGQILVQASLGRVMAASGVLQQRV